LWLKPPGPPRVLEENSEKEPSIFRLKAPWLEVPTHNLPWGSISKAVTNQPEEAAISCMVLSTKKANPLLVPIQRVSPCDLASWVTCAVGKLEFSGLKVSQE